MSSIKGRWCKITSRITMCIWLPSRMPGLTVPSNTTFSMDISSGSHSYTVGGPRSQEYTECDNVKLTFGKPSVSRYDTGSELCHSDRHLLADFHLSTQACSLWCSRTAQPPRSHLLAVAGAQMCPNPAE